ncbi:tail fiber domain-containing protein [Candidatus Kaiserbacteria bacterium]|nr:tail fiber domain-containing protein [Candidatus Kaiserbacteria bacterium]
MYDILSGITANRTLSYESGHAQGASAASALVSPAPTETVTSSSPATTTVNNYYVTKTIIDRPTPQTNVSIGFLPLLTAFEERITARLDALASPEPFPQQIGGGGVSAPFSYSVPAAQKIDQLNNAILSNVTVSGVSGLTDSDIPDDLTASNYLALAGGTLTGTLTGTNLTLSGDLTVSGAQTLSGAITIPYLSATSTTASTFIQASTTRLSVFDTAYFGGTATSTFDSAGNLYVAGNIGIGTTTPNQKLSVFNSTGDSAIEFSSLTGDLYKWTIGQDYSDGGKFKISSSTALGTNDRFVIDGSGNVGIGTTSPNGTLAVQGSSGTTDFVVANAIGVGIRVRAWNSGGTGVDFDPLITNDSFYFGKDTPLSKFVINSGNVGIGTTSPYAKLSVVGPVVAEYFYATSSAATSTFAGGIIGPNNFVVQSSSGNVGIGTTSPFKQFTIGAPDQADRALMFQTNSDTGITNGNGIRTDTSWSTAFDSLANFSFNLDTDANQGSTTPKFSIKDRFGTSVFNVDAGGKVGIGTTGPWLPLDVRVPYAKTDTTLRYGISVGSNEALASHPFIIAFGVLGAATDAARVGVLQTSNYGLATNGNLALQPNGGNVGISNTSPSVALDVTGSIEYTGTITDVSDARLKENITPLASNLEKILQLNPVSFNMIGATSTQLGFIAQNVQRFFPETVSVIDEEGHLGLDYTQLVAPAVGAIQELDLNLETIASTTASSTPQSQRFAGAFFSSLFTRLTEWFADAGNGIGEFFAASIHTGSLAFSRAIGQELCLGETCITESDLKEFLQSKNGREAQTAAAAEPPASITEDIGTPERSDLSGVPIIAIQGANPATIKVSDTYQDLGATITGPTDADKNLGLRYFVDGAAVSSVSLDISASTTHTIDYVATNSSGTATSTRTVVIQAPAGDMNATDASTPALGSGNASDGAASSTAGSP